LLLATVVLYLYVSRRYPEAAADLAAEGKELYGSGLLARIVEEQHQLCAQAQEKYEHALAREPEQAWFRSALAATLVARSALERWKWIGQQGVPTRRGGSGRQSVRRVRVGMLGYGAVFAGSGCSRCGSGDNPGASGTEVHGGVSRASDQWDTISTLKTRRAGRDRQRGLHLRAAERN
jgi:hypothetical protein